MEIVGVGREEIEGYGGSVGVGGMVVMDMRDGVCHAWPVVERGF